MARVVYVSERGRKATVVSQNKTQAAVDFERVDPKTGEVAVIRRDVPIDLLAAALLAYTEVA